MGPNHENYFDNSATTPMDPRVLSEMMPYLTSECGNAHSIHSAGRQAHAAVELARERVSQLLGAEDPSQIIFTSGATESNATVFHAFAGMPVAISPFEHSSVYTHRDDPHVTVLGYDIEADRLLDLPNEAALVSVMSVNNETGKLIALPESCGQARIHRDITQQVGKMPVNLAGVSFACGSGHKIYGPKGVGFLYCEDGYIEPFLKGGGQESGSRSGTLNVPGIVGIGAACALAGDEMDADFAHAVLLNQTFREVFGVEKLTAEGRLKMNSDPEQSPYILSLSLIELLGETLVIELDHAGFCTSAGAACSSQQTILSPNLTALGLSEAWNRGTLRVSFGRFNSVESTVALAKILGRLCENLRS